MAETFDRTSGQIFIEQTVAVRPRRLATRLNPRLARQVYREPYAASSLEAMARRRFVRELEEWPAHASDELVELLQHIPWQVAQNIWRDAARE